MSIAIIGMACRFPGASTPQKFWHNLVHGVESITRFTDAELLAAGVDAQLVHHPHYVKAAPVLDNYDGFDAAFFGYAPREARLMDPQHRLFLEVAWEAFEHAGYDPLGEKGIVGLYVGAGGLVSSYLLHHDHPELRGQTGDLGHLGNDRDFLCSRVSFKLNLTGPSLNVQTACSTSLVAVHLACRSLLDGETDLALAGASVVRVPHRSGYLAESGNIYSPDGHCRPFDAQASGTLFGSGVAAVVLKPLAAALADGDCIYAVLKGSAVNNDGAMKVSYTASSVASQARAMVEAMAIADVQPDSIGYVECHGTATALGDPIEIQALTRAFRLGTERTGFCPIGSVKSNLGHLEHCAGLAGLLKTVLILHHGLIPPSLHYTTPNPRIAFEPSPFFVNTSLRPFEPSQTPRCAGVNSVGMGGTNAFVVLEEAPPLQEKPVNGRSWFLLNLSAKSREALTAQVTQVRTVLAAENAPDLGDVCFTANRGRHHFAYRFAAMGRDQADILAQLKQFVADQRCAPRSGQPHVVWMFTGQGAQYARMGQVLYHTEPRVRQSLDRCLALFADAGIPLADVWFNDDDTQLNQTLYTQPALFSLQMALTALWQDWGITPDTVIGHSIGEVAAAVVAGICSLDDAIRLVAARARLMQDLPGGGAMAAIAADTHTVSAIWPEEAVDLAIAAENAPTSTVVSGRASALAALVERAQARQLPVAWLKVSHAFHSPLMEPMLETFATVAATVTFHPPRIRWISTLTGEEMTQAPEATYWCEQIRQTVRFQAAIAAAVCPAARFVEIGPGTTLINLGKQCVPQRQTPAEEPPWVASLGTRGDEWHSMVQALRQLYLQGSSMQWERFEACSGRRVSLPTYPFQHQRYWLQPRAPAAVHSEAVLPVHRARPHPLLGDRLGGDSVRFEAFVTLDRFPFLQDHRVFQQVVWPTTAALDTLMAAALQSLGCTRPVIAGFVYQLALTMPHDQPVWIHLTLEPQNDRATFRLESTSVDGADTWHLHLSGTVQDHTEPPALPRFIPHAMQARGDPMAPEQFYRFLHATGLSYGPAFQGIVGLWRQENEAWAKVELAAELAAEDYLLHPAFLDACLHIYPALVRKYGRFALQDAVPAKTYVPMSLDAFHLYRPGVRQGWVHAVVVWRQEPEESRLTIDIRVYADDGAPVALLRGVTIHEVSSELLTPTPSSTFEPLLYQVQWREVPCPETLALFPKHWYIFTDATGVGERVAALLSAEGCTCVVFTPDSLAGNADQHSEPAWVDRLLTELPDESVGMVYLWGLSVPYAESHAMADTNAPVYGGCLHVIQALDRIHQRLQHPLRLWLVTRGAQGNEDGWPVLEVEQSPLWGLGRTFAVEYPDLWGGLIDLPCESQETLAALLLQELKAADGEDQIMLRAGKRLVPRLVRGAAANLASQPVALAPDATYWIVGGLGGIGLKTAAAFVHAGARHLVLTGRQAAETQAPEDLTELRRHAEVVVLASDVTQDTAVEAVLGYIQQHLPPLKGVIHAAAVFEDAILANTTWEQFRRVLRPKVTGAWLLHRSTQELALDFFVMFSSVLSLWGAVGQAAYTAANSFLDALASYRRAAGLPATVVNWGPWAEVGLTERLGRTGTMLWQQRGTTPLAPEVLFEVLLHSLPRGPMQITVCETHWPTFLSQFQEVPPLYRELAPAGERFSVPSTSGDECTRVLDLMHRYARQVLGLEGGLDVSQPLNELGLDSLLAVNLANQLRQALNVTVPPALLLKGPSLIELRAALFPELAASQDDAGGPEGSTASVEANRWLIFHRPQPDARVRLFCFPFAGGGAATFRPWTAYLEASIELVAIEPPGRQTRIDEPPLRDMTTFLAQCIPALLPFLDKPFAVYGHCLGALTLFETVRTLIREHQRAPVHIFVSGARPPDQLHQQQFFETHLLERLLALPSYNLFEPMYQQPDDVFGEVIRQFNIPATEAFLQDPGLRHLLLPVIRAEFEMSSKYRYVPEPPWEVPITCLTGIHDAYVSTDNARAWSRFTSTQFQLITIESEHFLVVDDDQVLIQVINRELMHPL